MESKNKGIFYICLSFFLYLLYSVIEFVLSRKIIWNDALFQQPTNPPMSIDLLLTFLMGFRYVLLFFVILFFFVSVYNFSFAYPNKRNKIPLILSLIGVPLFMAIEIFINPPQGDMAGLGWLIYFIFVIPASTLVFLGISFFISKIGYSADIQRKKEKKHSIFFLPIIIAFILFILFSTLTYFGKDYGFRNSASKILIDALTGFSNSMPLVFVYIPIIIFVAIAWIYHMLRKK